MLHIFLNINYAQVTVGISQKIWGAAIFIQEDQNLTTMKLQKYCKERDNEISVVQVIFSEKKVIILCIYRAPAGDYDYLLNKLEHILNSLHTYNSEFILCGEISINYLEINSRKK
jgi:exonuclease III